MTSSSSRWHPHHGKHPTKQLSLRTAPVPGDTRTTANTPLSSYHYDQLQFPVTPAPRQTPHSAAIITTSSSSRWHPHHGKHPTQQLSLRPAPVPGDPRTTANTPLSRQAGKRNRNLFRNSPCKVQQVVWFVRCLPLRSVRSTFVSQDNTGIR